MDLDSPICLVPRDAVKLRRAVAERSYSAVARSARCAKSHLWELCNGRSGRVSAALAARIEDALDCPRGTLFALPPATAELLRPYG